MAKSIEFLLKCLDVIEERENRLLVWGIVDGALRRSELEDIVDPLIDYAINAGQRSFLSADEVIKALCAHGLLHSFRDQRGEHFRSRMAESVRLMSRLRQLFLRHAGANGWQNAPTLVADYRFIRRKRKYPRRDIQVATAIERISKVVGQTFKREAVRNLLQRADSDKFRLAEFQLRATERILEGAQKRGNQGTIVSAGTGSGKTLAFYVPTLAHTAQRIAEGSNDESWVKAIAIYPRNELLKDQFSEVYSEARRLDQLLSSRGKRKLRIGAFFGPTPRRAEDVGESSGWRPVTGGWACEYLRCPTAECSGKLVWREEDRQRGQEVLICNRCNHTVHDDEIILTRRRLVEIPPDVLFTTTEMLNQRLSDSWTRHLFGLGPRAQRTPELLLLDEVHTYAGTHGAQVSYLLRRWRYLTRCNVNVVGLSATLRDAPRFFASLTGLKEEQVAEITPLHEQMESEGAEYMLALRGDPVSRTSLLSTTIQAAMLSARALDECARPLSNGAYGNKVFVFTDDIDVTNRLYFNLLDAEGRDSFGNPDMRNKPNGGLAVLRRMMQNPLRYEFGQDWRMCEELGHDLSNRMRIGRTSSQDVGVDVDANIIVATASLEVGYNDPNVGSVVQHKAPRDMAQFLQRKGRAGRPRVMRPWTVVVLSDYGRDRLAYQGYELLFDPELDAKNLPVRNRYVQRMQAVYGLIDYLGIRLEHFQPRGSVWTDLSGPKEPGSPQFRRNERLVQELKVLLESEVALTDFAFHLGGALGLDKDSVGALLWEYPRPMMTAVLPTALRRLSSNWRFGDEMGAAKFVRNSPLPEFIPPNLFSDLNLPEVSIELPSHGNDEPITEAMPIFQAMREFTPGRVSRRYGVAHRFERHWIAPEAITADPVQLIDLNSVGDASPLGECAYLDGDMARNILTYRPNCYRTRTPDPGVADSSNARLHWATQVVPSTQGIPVDIPKGSTWSEIVRQMTFYTHNRHMPVEVRRFASESHATINYRNGEQREITFRFTDHDAPVALGYAILVDGVSFSLRLPSNLWQVVTSHNTPKWRSLRTARFFDLARRGDGLQSVTNPFTREWLAQIYLSGLVHQSMLAQSALQDAAVALHSGTAELDLTQVLSAIFQTAVVDDDTAQNGGTVDKSQDRLRLELEQHLGNPQVRRELENIAGCLWEPIDHSWESWLRRCYKATVAAAFFYAVQSLCPDLDPEGLVVDIDPGPRGTDLTSQEYGQAEEIWITENTVGGGGLIEQLITRYAEDPRRFFSLVEAALHASEYELNDIQLSRFLDAVAGPTPLHHVQETTEVFRRADTSAELDTAFGNMRSALTEAGFVLYHSFIASLNNRVLRPGSSSRSDEFIQSTLRFWREQEERIGIEIDARVVAYLRSRESEIDEVIEAPDVENVAFDLPSWRYNTIYSLLWPRGSAIRNARLTVFNPFSNFPKPERLLVLQTIRRTHPRIDGDDPNWEPKCLQGLREAGVVSVCSRLTDKLVLKRIFNFLMTNAVDMDYLLLYPRLRFIRQTIDTIEVEIELAGSIQ